MPAEGVALCAVPFVYGFPNVSEAILGPVVNASTCAEWAAFRGSTAWCMDNEYLFDLTSKGTCYLYATPFHPVDGVANDDDNEPDDYWVFCDRQAITSPTGAPTTTSPTASGESYSPTVSPTAQAADFGEEANALCATGLQIGNPPAIEALGGNLFLSNLTAAECAAAAADIEGATAWFLDNEYLVDLTVRGVDSDCPYDDDIDDIIRYNCSRSSYCLYVTQAFNVSDLEDDDTLNGDYWVFCDLQTYDRRRSLTDMTAKIKEGLDNGRLVTDDDGGSFEDNVIHIVREVEDDATAVLSRFSRDGEESGSGSGSSYGEEYSLPPGCSDDAESLCDVKLTCSPLRPPDGTACSPSHPCYCHVLSLTSRPTSSPTPLSIDDSATVLTAHLTSILEARTSDSVTVVEALDAGADGVSKWVNEMKELWSGTEDNAVTSAALREAFSEAQAQASNFTMVVAASLEAGVVAQSTSGDGTIVMTSARAPLDSDRLTYPFFHPDFEGEATCLEDQGAVLDAESPCFVPGIAVGTGAPTLAPNTPTPTMAAASGILTCDSSFTDNTTGAPHVVGTGSGEHYYRLTVLHARQYTFSTCVGSAYDTRLRLYSGNHLDATGTQVAQNDDACDLQSKIRRMLAAGEYTVIVEGYSSSSEGEYTLTTTCGTRQPTAAPTPAPTWSPTSGPPIFTVTLPTLRDIGATDPSAPVGFVTMSGLPFGDIIGSTVVSITVGGVAHNTPFSNTAAKMRFNMTVAASDKVGDVDPCVYWDEEDNAWSATGCKHLGTYESVVMCECSHLTTFAVLADANVDSGVGSGLSEEELHNLAWFVFLCVGISIVCLTIVVLVYAVGSELRTEAKTILLHLCIMYDLALILFLATATSNFTGDGCIAVGAALHFALLSTFLWMLVEGRHLHQTFVNVFSQRRAQEGRQLAVYCGVAYGGPAVEVVVLVSVWPAAYERDDGLCFLSKSEGAIWFFLGPALLVIALNAYVLVQVSREVWSLGVVDKPDSRTAETIAKTKRAFKSSLVFGSILGITWVFGLLSLVVPNSLAFNYFFAICNALGGLWIFAFHLLKDPEVRKKLRSGRLGTFLSSANGKRKPQKHHVAVVRRKRGSVKFDGTGGTRTDRSVSSDGGAASTDGNLSARSSQPDTVGLAETSFKPPSPAARPSGGNDYAECNDAVDARNGYVHVELKQGNATLPKSPMSQVGLKGPPADSEKLQIRMDSSGGAYSVGSIRTEENDYSPGSAPEDDSHSISSAPEEVDYALGAAPAESDYAIGSAPEEVDYALGAAEENTANGNANSSTGDNTQSLANDTYYASADDVGIGAWMDGSN
jgi:hypothetical protein